LEFGALLPWEDILKEETSLNMAAAGKEIFI
jgi:hypothetical protein